MNRCGHCYERGHNRATCPKLKRAVEENPDSWAARQHKARRASAKQRTCSYCHIPGHNKKTCPQIRSDTVVKAQANKTFRKDFLTRCKALGFGPGTLVEFKLHEGASTYQKRNFEDFRQKRGSLAMVVGFNSDYINADLVEKSFGAQKLIVKLKFPKGGDVSIRLPQEFSGFINANNVSPQMYIGCEVNMENIEKSFSADWKSGHAGVPEQLGLNK